MSDFSVIAAISNTLLSVLNQQITVPPGPLQNIPISLLSPQEMREGGKSGVSVWLYKVSRMAEMLNEPPERKSANQITRVPLRVQMYYLVTPIMSDPIARHTVLGKVLQVFNDRSIIRGADLQGILQGTTEQLRVNLEALSIEELSQVWEALAEPYQLSVTYLIQVAKIDSDREAVMAGPVLERDAKYTQIVSEI